MAVRKLLAKDGTGGFSFLKENGVLQLSVEALVAVGQWDNLFQAADREAAHRKLR